MESHSISRVEWRRVFPWLWIFQTFRLAIDLRKILLCMVGLIMIAGGNLAIDRLGMRQAPGDADFLASPQHLYPWEVTARIGSRTGDPLQLLTSPESFKAFFTDWQVLWYPFVSGAMEPAYTLASSSQNSFPANVDALLRLFWFMLVWSVVGGAVTRMAIFEFVKDEKLGIRAAIGFSSRKLFDFLIAPLLPLGGTLFLLLFCALGGLLGNIPSVGPTIVAIFWFIPLLISVGILIMLIGVGAGWPLMVGAISTEDSDGFDAFSRAHSYVFDVPWHYLWSLFVVMCYASAAVFFFDLAAGWVAHLAQLGVGWGMGEDSVRDMLHDEGSGTAGMIGGFWGRVIDSLRMGFRASFFWVSFLMIYLVLRHASDKNSMKDAFLEPLEEGQERAMALSGMSATEEAIVERDVVNPDGTPNPNATEVSGEQQTDSDGANGGSEADKQE